MQQFMSFSDYVQSQMAQAFNREEIRETPTVNQEKDTPSSVLAGLNKKTWNAKIIGKEKYLFFNEHYVNITKLKDEIQKLYKANGYEHYGFGKLGESELVRYKTLRDILMSEFLRYDTDDELDPAMIAQIIFDHEAKDFTWQPEPLTL